MDGTMYELGMCRSLFPPEGNLSILGTTCRLGIQAWTRKGSLLGDKLPSNPSGSFMGLQ